MKIIFTKSDSILSKQIRALTEEPVSHVALWFGWFIVHSNLRGVHIELAQSFFNSSKIIYTIEKTARNETTEDDDLNNLKRLLEKFDFSFYDFGALLFLGLAFFFRLKFSIPLPKSNLWQSSGMFLCTEWVSRVLNIEENAMITPYQMYLELKETGRWKDDSSQDNKSLR